MSAAAAALVPRAREWRARLSRARRAHHGRSRGDVLTDLYMMLWLGVVYGGILISDVRDHLGGPPGAPGAALERAWLGTGVLLAGAGGLWTMLRSLGPLLATPAEQAWGLSTPIDRRGWLLPRFARLTGGGALAAALAAAAFSILAVRGAGLGLTALAGLGWGAAGVALAVAAQGAPAGRRWPAAVGRALLAAGAAAAGAVVAARYGGRALPRPAGPVAPGLALLGAVAAVAAVTPALRVLGRLDRAALGEGAALAGAAVSAAVGIDPWQLSRMIELRRWRRLARVRSRPFPRALPGRWGALLAAEMRRATRRPGALAMWAALALAQYAVAVVAPSLAAPAHVVGAYLAAGRLAGGLRTVARSPGLRRALGGDELRLRLVHLALPALGTILWWALTFPAGGPPLGPAEILLVAGVVAAAYRAATRPPMSYGGALIETPIGLVPVELIRQLARGPDVLAVVMIAQALLSR